MSNPNPQAPVERDIRAICPHCKKETTVKARNARVLNFDEISVVTLVHAQPFQCQNCNNWLNCIIGDLRLALMWIPCQPPADAPRIIPATILPAN